MWTHFLKNSLDSPYLKVAFSTEFRWLLKALEAWRRIYTKFNELGVFYARFSPDKLARKAIFTSDHLIKFTFNYKHDERRCASVERQGNSVENDDENKAQHLWMRQRWVLCPTCTNEVSRGKWSSHTALKHTQHNAAQHLTVCWGDQVM